MARMHTVTNVRPSPLAGQWYPADSEQLAHSIDAYLDQAAVPSLHGELLALVTPHAGHTYSGPVAGHAFATLKGASPELVVILSPMHQPYAEPLLTTIHEAYHTPLGDVAVDQETLGKLTRAMRDQTGVKIISVERDKEHAVEIELPFLQRVLPEEFKFIPIMIRNQDPALMQALAYVLAEHLPLHESLLIASTDLSHFHPAQKARSLDRTIIDHILNLDPEGIYQAENNKTGFACGKGALATTLWAVKQIGADHARLLNYGHSGEVTGDNTRVVGYAAAAITKMVHSPFRSESLPAS